jgi:hypothetical protein
MFGEAAIHGEVATLSQPARQRVSATSHADFGSFTNLL